MALATQCPHCNTTFRVAADQLKLRGGIVRCGACHEVFDGNAALVDLDTLHAPPPPEQHAETAPPHDTHAALPETAERSMPAEATPEPAAEAPAPPAEVDEEPIYTLNFDRTFDPFGNLPKAGPLTEPAPEPAPPPPPLNVNFTLDLDSPPRELLAPEPVHEEVAVAEPAPYTEEDTIPGPVFTDDDIAALAEYVQLTPEIATEPDPDVKAEPEEASELPLDPIEQAIPELAEPPRPRMRGKSRVRSRARAPVVTEEFPETELLHSHQHDELPPSALDPVPADVEAEATLAPEAEHEEPGFVKRAKRAERMGRVWRILMLTGSVLLVLTLAMQGVTTFRNVIAAMYPQFNPALAQACATLGCTLELPTQVDTLAIETGELQTLGGENFALTTQLRNQGALAQAWPHIELVLTDANDKPLLRRVLRPADYLPPAVNQAKGFAAHSEQPVKLYFAVSQVKASGYRIAVFYP